MTVDFRADCIYYYSRQAPPNAALPVDLRSKGLVEEAPVEVPFGLCIKPSLNRLYLRWMQPNKKMHIFKC